MEPRLTEEIQIERLFEHIRDRAPKNPYFERENE